MAENLTPSLLHLELLDLRRVIKSYKEKYSSKYPQNTFHVFISNVIYSETNYLPLTPMFFDLTDNVIRYSLEEQKLIRTDVGAGTFFPELNLYKDADIQYKDLVKFECKNKELYSHLFSVLQELNGICVPYFNIKNKDESTIKLEEHLQIAIGFNSPKTDVLAYRPLSVYDGCILFNSVKMTTKEFTPINVLRKLFRLADYELLISSIGNDLKLSSFKDCFNKLKIELVKPNTQPTHVITDGALVTVVKARITTSYLTELEINIGTEIGSNVLTTVLQWVLNIGKWLNSVDEVYSDGKLVEEESVNVAKLFGQLNYFFYRLAYSTKQIEEDDVEVISKGEQFFNAALDAFNYVIRDNYSYNCDGLMLDVPIEELKEKLNDANIDSEEIDVVPGRVFKDGKELHGIIFVNLNTHTYGFYSKMFDIFLPDLFVSPMLKVSNGKEVIKSLFRCIRSLNVKEYLSTMFVSEEVKDFGLSEKKTNNYLTLGIGGQIQEDGKQKLVTTVLFNRDTSVRPPAGKILEIEDLNPQKFKDFVSTVFNKL